MALQGLGTVGYSNMIGTGKHLHSPSWRPDGKPLTIAYLLSPSTASDEIFAFQAGFILLHQLHSAFDALHRIHTLLFSCVDEPQDGSLLLHYYKFQYDF